MPDGFTDILSDHRNVLELLERYARHPDDAVAQQACREIALHAEVEELVLYPHARRLGPGEDPARGPADGIQLVERAELVDAAIATEVARVAATPPADLRPLMAQITEQVREHITFEENEMLPQLRAMVDAEALHTAIAEAKDTIRARAGEPMF